MSFRGGQGPGPGLLAILVESLRIFLGIQKHDRKTEGSKTPKNAKMSLQGSKKTSKIEPKVISGRGFSDFGQSLISCNTTMVLLDFHGFRVPRGGQKTIKKRCRKRNVEKDGAKPIFLQKSVKIDCKMDSDLDHEFSPNSPPRGLCSDLGPKGAQKERKGAKKMLKDTKRGQKGAKRIPKSCENR